MEDIGMIECTQREEKLIFKLAEDGKICALYGHQWINETVNNGKILGRECICCKRREEWVSEWRELRSE